MRVARNSRSARVLLANKGTCLSASTLVLLIEPRITRPRPAWRAIGSGRAPFLRYRLQCALQSILIRGPQHPVRRHQTFGARLAQGRFETLRVRMVAQLIPQQGLTLCLPFRRRREVLALLNHHPASVHHLLQARDETVPVESLRRAGRALPAYRPPLARAAGRRGPRGGAPVNCRPLPVVSRA